MTEKTFKLITAIVGGVETIAVGLVTYFNPAAATAINASIVVAGTAIIEICNQFVVADYNSPFEVGDVFADDKGKMYKVIGFDNVERPICEEYKDK